MSSEKVSTHCSPVFVPPATFQSAPYISFGRVKRHCRHTVSIKCDVVSDSPDDGDHSHSERDGADAVIDVSVRRAHERRGIAKHFLDSLAGPSKFSDELLVCLGRHVL